MIWGIVPAAGKGSRIQPLAFSKELLAVGSRPDGGGERPRAVSEYLVERLILGGAEKICFVIAPGKLDILQYYSAGVDGVYACYAVQPEPVGLCDAIFRAAPLISQAERVLVGLPDTVWFPADAMRTLPTDILALLLFPVEHPELFDAVVCDQSGRVREVQVKHERPDSNWVWGAFGMPGKVYHELHGLWRARGCRDEYIGTLVNAYLLKGGTAVAVRAGTAYVDVGTLHGYHEAIRLLTEDPRAAD